MEKDQSLVDQGKGILDRALWFSDQDTIEGVITFRIDSRLSRGDITVKSFNQVPLGSCSTCIRI
jgi:hypothetical protein